MSIKSKRVNDAIKTVRKNISIRKDVLILLKKMSNETHYSESKIIEFALLEHFDTHFKK